MSKRSRTALLVPAMACLALSPALAFIDADTSTSAPKVMTSPPPPGGYAPSMWASSNTHAVREALIASPAWRRFTSVDAPGWTAQWNPLTGTPHFATGPAASIPGYGRLTRENIKAACAAFISRNSTLLRADLTNLRMVRAAHAGGRWYVTYRQTVRGVPVYGGMLRMAFSKNDRLVMFGSDVHPDIKIETTPRIDAKAALEVAEASCPAGSGGDRVSLPGLCILPEPKTGGFDYRLCWKVEILRRAQHRRWLCFVDATDGRLVGKWDTLWYGNATGTVRGEYKPEFEGDATETDLMRYANVHAEGPEVVIASWNFDTNPGWDLQGQWQYGKPTGGGSHSKDPTAGYTGLNIVGYNLAGDYANNIGTTYYATTPAINCTGFTDVRLRFYRRLGIEDAIWDQAVIQASNDGATWVNVWKHEGGAIDDSGWSYMDYDISPVADNQTSVWIRFGLGPTDTSVTYPGWNLDDVRIVSVTGGLNRSTTLEDGSYSVSLPWEPSTLVSKLEGSFCDIDYGGGDAWFIRDGIVPDAVVDWTWDSAVYNKIDEPSVYRHINFIHDYYKTLDPEFTGLDYPVPTLVAIPGYANAYWDGTGVAFGAGDGVYYRDFGLSSEIVYHEYTHGVTDKIYTGIDFPYADEPGAMNEGWSDYFGCLLSLSQTPKVGDGGVIVGSPDGFRTLDNSFRRETDWYGEVHEDSQMFSGALWEARQALGGEVMDKLVHYARYAHAMTFEDEVLAILLEDDTRYGDSDLSNGTPHGEVIYSAFGRHGIGGLRYAISSLVIDDSRGNGSGKLEPGESAGIILSLTNGWADATNIRATLVCSDQFVTVTRATASFTNVPHGGMVSNSSNPFQVKLRADCPETHTINLRLDISADGPYCYTRQSLLHTTVAVGQVANDDGQPDLYTAVYPNDGLCVRLTPEFYPFFPTHIRLYPYDPRPVVLSIWDDNGADGSPGTLLKTISVNPDATEQWYDVDISSLNLTIDSGSVYVGWIGSDTYYANALDMDPPDSGRTWYYQNWSKKWYPISGNMMIRLRYVPPVTAGQAKSVPDGATVSCAGRVVTAAFAGLFYIEEPDRSAGIRAEKADHGLAVGARVTVSGLASTSANGEKCISVTKLAQSGTGHIEPLAMTNRDLGGGAFAGQDALWGWRWGRESAYELRPATGLSNIGLLVKTTGTVTAWGRGWFYIDDGSRVDDGTGNIGVYVKAPDLMPPPTGSVVSVTGISSCEYYNEKLVNVLLTRDSGDVVVLRRPEAAVEVGR